jgi:hypothetical protein
MVDHPKVNCGQSRQKIEKSKKNCTLNQSYIIILHEPKVYFYTGLVRPEFNFYASYGFALVMFIFCSGFCRIKF